MNQSAQIKDIAVYLPNTVLTNDDLADLFPDWSSEKILEKTGISERRIASEHQTAGDMAFEAARNLFIQGKVVPKDVDFIILCTQAPDYILPTTACLLQDRLGIPRHAGALDINLGCSGFVYGLSLAKGLIETGSAQCVLLLTSDTYSKYIHPLDKSVRTIFGDAAAATVIVAKDDTNPSIGPFIFGTDGGGADNLIVRSGMFRHSRNDVNNINNTDDSSNATSFDNLYMNGAEVMSFSLTEVPRAVDNLLIKASKLKNQVDFYVFHQANKFMLEALRKKIGLQNINFPILMNDVGNTVSSTIPITIFKMREKGMLDSRSLLMLVGFGVGYSWAACMLDLDAQVSY